jgi:hypothetical protein
VYIIHILIQLVNRVVFTHGTDYRSSPSLISSSTA